jgi:serine/threonine protein phosphatase 1
MTEWRAAFSDASFTQLLNGARVGAIQSFERNTAGRDFVVGDIHGAFSRLEAALADVRFDVERDRLFSVGDLVDRGPESERVLEFLDKPWFHAVMGNHEWLAMAFTLGDIDAQNYNANGGAWLIAKPDAERGEYCIRFCDLPLGIEVDIGDGQRVGIVHADCPRASWDAFKDGLDGDQKGALSMAAMWSRDRADGYREGPITDVAAVVVGHTPMECVTSMDNVFYIDTGAFIPGHALTVVQLAPRPGVVLEEVAKA